MPKIGKASRYFSKFCLHPLIIQRINYLILFCHHGTGVVIWVMEDIKLGKIYKALAQWLGWIMNLTNSVLSF